MSQKFTDWFMKYSIPVSGVIHAGSHLGQEMKDYKSLGFEKIIWIEANPKIVLELEKSIQNDPNQIVISACLWSVDNQKVEFNIAGIESSSSSILEPFLISASHPEVEVSEKITLITSKLDSLIYSKFDHEEYSDYGVLVIDVQGAELDVIKGAEELLTQIDAIFLELSTRELYKGYSSKNEIVKYLKEKRFEFMASEIDSGTGWGEGLFLSSKLIQKNDLKISDQVHVIKGKKLNIGTFLRTMLLKLGISVKLVRKIRRL